jgi:hypothetical protein
MLTKLLTTVAAFVVYGIAEAVYNPVQTVLSGEVAGHQFDNSDLSYVGTMLSFNLLNGVGGLFSIALVIALVVIWASTVVNLFKNANSGGSNA